MPTTQREKDEALRIMREIAAGWLRREDIRGLESYWVKVHAAVAFMLVHASDFLDGLRVRGNYENLLAELVGYEGIPNYLGAVSRRAGLHTSSRTAGVRGHAGRVVTLVPPGGVEWPSSVAAAAAAAPDVPVESDALSRADHFLAILLAESDDVIREVHAGLNAHLIIVGHV